MILQETYTLSNGVKIPKIGLGTWQIPDGEDTYNSVMFALYPFSFKADITSRVELGSTTVSSVPTNAHIFVFDKLSKLSSVARMLPLTGAIHAKTSGSFT